MTTLSISRKSVLAFATLSVIAGSTVSGAEARNKTRDAIVAGAAVGLAIGIIGAASGGHARPYYVHRRHCFDKPIRKWNRWEGRKVIVGYKTVCR